MFFSLRPLSYLLSCFFIGFCLFLILYPYVFISKKVYTQEELPQIYSNDCGDHLQKLCIQAIEAAKKNIHLQIYSLTDPDVIRALNRASRKGIHIEITYDRRASPFFWLKKLDANIVKIPRGKKALMHRKILVVDQSYVWIGSANFTQESLMIHSNLIWGVKDKSLASHILHKGQGPFFFTHNQQKMHLYLLPKDTQAKKHLLDCIKKSRHTLKAALFTWTDHEIFEALVHAKKRGVKVEMIVEDTQLKSCGKKIVKLCKRENISLNTCRSIELMHHKFVWIDANTFIHGSCNWTRAAFSRNEDCLMIIQELTSPQKKKCQQIWKTLSLKSKKVL